MRFIAAAAGALALFGTTAIAQVDDPPIDDDDGQVEQDNDLLPIEDEDADEDETEPQDLPDAPIEPAQPGEDYSWTVEELSPGPWTFEQLVVVFPDLTEAHFEDLDADDDGRVTEEELMLGVEADVIAPPAG